MLGAPGGPAARSSSGHVSEQPNQRPAAVVASADGDQQSQNPTEQAASQGAEPNNSDAEQASKRQRRAPFPWCSTLERILQELDRRRQWNTLQAGGARAALADFRQRVADADQGGQSQLSVDELDLAAFKRKYQSMAKAGRSRAGAGQSNAAPAVSEHADGSGAGEPASAGRQEEQGQQQRQQQGERTHDSSISGAPGQAGPLGCLDSLLDLSQVFFQGASWTPRPAGCQRRCGPAWSSPAWGGLPSGWQLGARWRSACRRCSREGSGLLPRGESCASSC
ncbi:hypothetical protein ABPG75_012312 [Micractinium tetrahymenae]